MTKKKAPLPLLADIAAYISDKRPDSSGRSVASPLLAEKVGSYKEFEEWISRGLGDLDNKRKASEAGNDAKRKDFKDERDRRVAFAARQRRLGVTDAPQLADLYAEAFDCQKKRDALRRFFKRHRPS